MFLGNVCPVGCSAPLDSRERWGPAREALVMRDQRIVHDPASFRSRPRCGVGRSMEMDDLPDEDHRTANPLSPARPAEGSGCRRDADGARPHSLRSPGLGESLDRLPTRVTRIWPGPATDAFVEPPHEKLDVAQGGRQSMKDAPSSGCPMSRIPAKEVEE